MKSSQAVWAGPDSAGTLVLSTANLSAGDRVEAFHKGTLVYSGHVTDIAGHHDLFWIMDHPTGGRRLLDIVEFQVFRSAFAEDPSRGMADAATAG